MRSTNKFSMTVWFEDWGGTGGAVKIGCRPVHEYTLTDEVDYIKPKKRFIAPLTPPPNQLFARRLA